MCIDTEKLLKRTSKKDVLFYFVKKGGGKLAKLTLKQQKFADEYIISGNAMKSAIEAGYSKEYARSRSHEMLENVGIKTYIEERLAELNSQKIADQEEILQYLTSVMRGEYREETLIGMGQGVQETT